MLTRDQLIKLYLSGTVRFPTAFPALADLVIDGKGATFREGVPPKATLQVTDGQGNIHRLLLEEVSAVFVPNDAVKVDFSDGEWLIESEIEPNLDRIKEQAREKNNPNGKGIIFVPETARMLNALVDIGATAGESADLAPRTCCPDCMRP